METREEGGRMKRSEEDIERISEILGSYYEKSIRRGMFVVLVENGGMTAMSAGDRVMVYSAVAQYLSEVIANGSDSLAEAEGMVKATAEAMMRNAREEWEAAHGTPDISIKSSKPLTEEQMIALLGRKRPGMGREE